MKRRNFIALIGASVACRSLRRRSERGELIPAMHCKAGHSP
jgi:hypothetical protein